MNKPYNAHETLTLKFVEPGHTVMTADAVHAAVERKIVATKKRHQHRPFRRMCANCNQEHSTNQTCMQ